MQISKTLGAVAAVLALLAFAASSASAAAFQAAEYTAELKGQQEGAHVLTAEGGVSVKCTTVSMSGEMASASETIELTPTYSGCTASGLPATVATEGCKFRFDANANDMDIVCPGTNTILVKALGCEAKIGSQNGITTLTYSNLGVPQDISVKASLGGIKYNKTQDGALCPFSGTGEKEDGGLTGTTLLRAFVAGELEPLHVGALPLTKLCKEAKKTGCGSVYPSGTVLEGTGTGNAVFNYVIKKTPVKAECMESTFKATTSAKEAAFLPASTSVFSFNLCGGCTIASANTPFKTTIFALGNMNGFYEMVQSGAKGPVLELKNCNGETCIYEATAVSGTLVGNEPASLVFTKVVYGNVAKGSGANCELPLEYTNTYQLKEPKAGGVPKVWVSDG